MDEFEHLGKINVGIRICEICARQPHGEISGSETTTETSPEGLLIITPHEAGCALLVAQHSVENSMDSGD